MLSEIIIDPIFPHPRVLRKLYRLVEQDFARYSQANYAETPQTTGTGLEKEVIKLLEKYSSQYDYRVHLTDQTPERGFAGLLHKFDAGIEHRSDLSQCLFEVKYRGADVTLKHEDIMKFHHATFEYFLRRLNEHRWDESNIFRCFITNYEVTDDYRCFFYSWGILLIDPALRPIPLLLAVLRRFEEGYGTTDYLIDLIERANQLTEQAYFSLADLVPPEQKYGNALDLGRLNPAGDSKNILTEHRLLEDEIETLQRQYRRGRFR